MTQMTRIEGGLTRIAQIIANGIPEFVLIREIRVRRFSESVVIRVHPWLNFQVNIIRQMMMEAMMPTASAIKPAGTAWRVRFTATAPK